MLFSPQVLGKKRARMGSERRFPVGKRDLKRRAAGSGGAGKGSAAASCKAGGRFGVNWGVLVSQDVILRRVPPPTSPKCAPGGPGEGWVVSSRVNGAGEKAQRGNENSQREIAAKPGKVCPATRERCQLRCRASAG